MYLSSSVFFFFWSEQFMRYPTPPTQPVKLIFIHHSSGENWLMDTNGGLGIALRDSNYFVSDTNYGWGPVPGDGPDPIGSYTDIGNWWTWFRGPKSPVIMDAVYSESGQHSDYSRMIHDPGGKNQIILFKSCYPNSNLRGNPLDPVPSIDANPLRGVDCDSSDHTVANAKGIYIDLLPYFQQHQETLFIVITAPPLIDSTYSSNARVFNQWLVNDWLKNYPYKNVAVFDFYNVLTTNGGDATTNDLGWETGNHHRWWNNGIQHTVDTSGGVHNTSAYPSGSYNNHPSDAGNQKATAEFVPLLNAVYNQWPGAPQTKSTKIGIFRPGTGIWSLDSNGNYAWDVSDSSLNWGLPYDNPVIGDWNGDGKDDLGVFRPGSGIWSLDSNGNYAWDVSDKSLLWGLPGDLPVTGDWNGDGKDEIGIFRPGSGMWSLDSNGNYAWEVSDTKLSGDCRETCRSRVTGMAMEKMRLGYSGRAMVYGAWTQTGTLPGKSLI